MSAQSESSSEARRLRIPDLARLSHSGEKLAMLTAYDALTAPIFEAAGVDVLLVGDSLGNVQLGFDSTLPVSLDDMIRSTGAVARSTKRPLVVTDLPFGSFEESTGQAFSASAKLLKSGAQAVKIEGGRERADTISFLTQNGIPVMGHLGYTPQSEHTLGGPRLQGTGQQAQELLQDALAVQNAGAFSIVLEMVPASLAAKVTAKLDIPTFGIGAGPDCDGQVLVWSDMAGMTTWVPRFVKRFGSVGDALGTAARDYVEEVRAGKFPAAENTREE